MPERFPDEYVSLTDEDLGFKAVLSLDDPSDRNVYSIFIEDFKIDMSSDFLQRKFKRSIILQWHGQWASEAPLFREYMQLIKNKHDTYLRWAQVVLKVGMSGLEADRSTFSVGDTVVDDVGAEWQLVSERPESFFATRVGHDGTKTFAKDDLGVKPKSTRGRRLAEEPPSTAVAKPLEVFTVEQVADYLEMNIDSLDKTQFSDLQKAITEFHKLPKRQEVITGYKLGACVIQDIEFTKKKAVMVVCLNSHTGLMHRLHLRELTLSPSGVWRRETLGFTENVQWVARLFKPVAQFGAAVVAKWKQNKIMSKTIRFIFSNEAAVHRAGNNRGLMAGLTVALVMIPEFVGFVWDYVLEPVFLDPDYVRAVHAIDPTLPYGMRTYVNAITGDITVAPAQDTEGFMSKAKKLASETAEAVTTTIKTVFYGIVTIGGIAIVYKVLG